MEMYIFIGLSVSLTFIMFCVKNKVKNNQVQDPATDFTSLTVVKGSASPIEKLMSSFKLKKRKSLHLEVLHMDPVTREFGRTGNKAIGGLPLPDNSDEVRASVALSLADSSISANTGPPDLSILAPTEEARILRSNRRLIPPTPKRKKHFSILTPFSNFKTKKHKATNIMHTKTITSETLENHI